MKLKIKMPENYKRYFTLGDMEEVKRIKADSEQLECDIDTALEIAAAGGEILKVSAEWSYNRIHPEETYSGNGVDIYLTVYVLHEYDRFEVVNAGIQELLSKSIYEERVGFGGIYKFSGSFKTGRYR